MTRPYKKLTLSLLREYLDLDPVTGEWTWLQHQGRVTAGTKAGSRRRNGVYVIRIFGVTYTKERLQFFLEHGKWPKRCPTVRAPVGVGSEPHDNCIFASIHPSDFDVDI
jgi:hypothetical protein